MVDIKQKRKGDKGRPNKPTKLLVKILGYEGDNCVPAR
jgi:hypothetical protein